MPTLRFLLALLLLAALPARSLSAQSLKAAQLAALLHQTSAQAQLTLGEWVFRPKAMPATAEPLTWGWWPPSADAQSPPEALLSLRPDAGGGYDVVLWLHHAGQLHQLRRELEHAQLAPLPVTCLGCEGARYAAADYTATLYSGKPLPYPFVIVVHATQPAPGGGGASPGRALPDPAAALRPY